MADDFSKFEAMRNAGSTPEQIYRAALQDGFDTITLIHLIRAVFSLSPGQAKEVMVRAEGLATSLDEYQGKIADRLVEDADALGWKGMEAYRDGDF